MTASQRWSQWAVTTGTIVGLTWAAMVFALDTQYVQVEHFDKFKAEIKRDIDGVNSNIEISMQRAVTSVQCLSMEQELQQLETTRLYKRQRQESTELENMLIEQQRRALASRVDCGGRP